MIRPTPHVRSLLAALVLTVAAPSGARAATSSETESETGGGFAAPATTSGGTGFGQLRQFVVSMGLTSGEHAFFHKQSGGGWQLQLSPSLDYFILPHVSVGGVVAFGHESGGANMAANASGLDRITVGARAGYNFDFSERFSVWPLGGLNINYTSVNHSSNTNTWLGLYAPFLFHVAPHFFGGLGPSFQLNLSGADGNQYGLDSVIGGWF